MGQIITKSTYMCKRQSIICHTPDKVDMPDGIRGSSQSPWELKSPSSNVIMNSDNWDG